jgi:hypothetical protein
VENILRIILCGVIMAGCGLYGHKLKSASWDVRIAGASLVGICLLSVPAWFFQMPDWYYCLPFPLAAIGAVGIAVQIAKVKRDIRRTREIIKRLERGGD